MQLGGSSSDGPAPTDIAEALRTGARELGHRPAVTVLHPGARYEQSGVSLANWAAKGAHLLELDHLVGPGSTVGLQAPPCWTSASVALATWWLGGTVSLLVGGSTDVTVGHRASAGDQDAALAALLVGDGVDGAPLAADPATPPTVPAWTHEAQPLPDQPPPAQAQAALPALRTAQRTWQQAELLGLAAELGTGTAGVEAGRTDPVSALVAVALRPFVTGQATVVLRGVGRDTAAGEKVRTWL
ncbi:MAG: hypothetical protein R6U94_11805 [Nitriliruptoraceae bacterium]